MNLTISAETIRDVFPAQRETPLVTQENPKTTSALDRRMLDQLDETIQKAAEYTLLEFNDELSRGMFIDLVGPHLRHLQQRGILRNFRVVCVVDGIDWLEIVVSPSAITFSDRYVMSK